MTKIYFTRSQLCLKCYIFWALKNSEDQSNFPKSLIFDLKEMCNTSKNPEKSSFNFEKIFEVCNENVYLNISCFFFTVRDLRCLEFYADIS